MSALVITGAFVAGFAWGIVFATWRIRVLFRRRFGQYR